MMFAPYARSACGVKKCLSLPELFGSDDGIQPRLNISAAIPPNHSRLWILDPNLKRVVRFRFASAFVEVATQYVGGFNPLVPQNQGPHHFCRSIFTDSMPWKVFVK